VGEVGTSSGDEDEASFASCNDDDDDAISPSG